MGAGARLTSTSYYHMTPHAGVVDTSLDHPHLLWSYSSLLEGNPCVGVDLHQGAHHCYYLFPILVHLVHLLVWDSGI